MPHKFVKTTCCAQGAAVIQLQYLSIPDTHVRKLYMDYIAQTPPDWTMALVVQGNLGPSTQVRAVVFCPFCGETLPRPVRNKRQKNVRVVLDGGYYCATCSKRLIGCRCTSPEQFWRSPCA